MSSCKGPAKVASAEAPLMDQSTAVSESTKATEAEVESICLQMPDDLAQQINECIAKYNGTKDASIGQV